MTFANVVASVALFVALGGGAYAAISDAPASDGVIHACLRKSSGAVRVVPDGRRCRRSETALAWNQRGRRGAKGDRGPAGARGARGHTGARGPQGRQGTTGPQGPQGPRGDAGPQGAQGPAGADAPVPPPPAPVAPDTEWRFTMTTAGGDVSFPVTSLAVGAERTGGGTTISWALSLSKEHDRSSAALQRMAATGETAGTGTLAAYRPGTTAPYHEWTFTHVGVTSFSSSDAAGTAGESLVLTFPWSSTTPQELFHADAPYADVQSPANGDATFTTAFGDLPRMRLITDAFGASNDGTSVSYSAMTFSKPVDGTSPALLDALREDTTYPQVVLHRTGDDGHVDTTYTLTDAQVQAVYQYSGLSFDEVVTLTFRRIETTTTLADGSTATACWDVVQHQAC